MRIKIAVFLVLAGLATAPAAYGQQRPHDGARTDAADQLGMMSMHGDQAMMHQDGMMGKMMDSCPLAIVDRKEALGLDESQIERLEELGGQMTELRQAHMKSMKRLQADALDVLTDDQRSNLDGGMSGMMMQGDTKGRSCSMMSGMKEDT